MHNKVIFGLAILGILIIPSLLISDGAVGESGAAEVLGYGQTTPADDAIAIDMLTRSQPGDIIDLTNESSNIVFAIVNQLMIYPYLYEGITIRAGGEYVNYQAIEGIRHSVYIKDALGCCPYGIEFIWDDGSHLDSEYPEVTTSIIVTGTVEAYNEYNTDYMRLVDATLEIV